MKSSLFYCECFEAFYNIYVKQILIDYIWLDIK